MRSILFILLLTCAVTAQARDFWNKLWLTPDQRGERLLQQGDAGAAAQTFRDPRRKAYAELKAGQYRRAAHDLAQSSNGDDLYNRGNALARAGQLQQAIKAYDAALQRDPHNRDARHNRDLVERALQKQQQHKSSANSGGASGKNGKQKKAAGNNSAKNKNGGSHNQPGQNQAGNNRQDKSGKNKQDHRGRGKAAQPHNQGQQKSQTARARQAAPAHAKNQPGKAANQARRDAMAALNKPRSAQQRHQAPGITKPLSEQQISQQQWLRQIPDDPGGLLRRKFMIEHMIRQREAQQ